MSKTHFTVTQQQAIDDQGQNILVSASAGSGKTSVLVERVIQKILGGESIDRLLVVTFTEAAAKGMRDRIGQALKEAIAQTNTTDVKQHLKNQLNRLAVADISTLHAFCLHLIKQYYYLINLDPQFRLLTDETEGILLRENVWNDVRETLYASGDPAFEQLTRNFSSDRSDDGLTTVVNQLDSYATATPRPHEWLAQLPTTYAVGGGPLIETAMYQQQVLPALVDVLQQIEADLADALHQAGGDGFEKVQAVLEAELEQAKTAEKLVGSASWDDCRQFLQALKFSTLRGPKDDEAKATFESIKELRNNAKKAINALAPHYFALDEATTKQISSQAEQLVTTLVDVVERYRAAYQAEKQRRHVLDFSDLEHYALQILTTATPDGQAVVAQLRDHYHEIMVDEYQDTNQLQESILQTLVNDDPGNMFMVGDVKQSIYQFRQADPSLFLRKYTTYRQPESTDGETIVLAENFRSVNNVTDFTNLIFQQLMDTQVGEMDYDEDAHLKYGATDYPDRGVPTEIMLYDSTTEPTALDQKLPLLEAGDKLTGEIQMVGLRIQRMIEQHELVYDRKAQQMRPISYGDITLLSATKNNNNLIVEQFSQLGIPVTVRDAQNYFQATEVRIMMALLRIIDNPYQDIPLAAVLRSPMVGLDENELAYLRIQDKTDEYFAAVTKFARATPKDAFAEQLQVKIRRFLDQLTKFRTIANQNRLVDLIWAIYDETGFLDYVGGMPGGKQRQANLHALYQRAAMYEQSSFKGVFQFVRFIEQMQKRNKDLAQAPAQTSSDTVSVMTIHGSKGLEFPVVFLIDATHQFNMESLRQDCLLDAHAGIGVTYLNDENVKVATLQKQIVKDTIQNKSRAEEMRVLYVALTRAEQRLIIAGAYKDANKAIANWQRAFQSSGMLLPNQQRAQATNFMDWIGMSLVRHPQFDQNLLTDPQPWYGLGKDQTTFTVQVVTAADLQQDAADEPVGVPSIDEQIETATDGQLSSAEQQAVLQVLNLQYDYQAATMTTAYQSVSEIKRLFDDPDNQELIQIELNPQARSEGRYVKSEFGQPHFMQQEQTATPTQIGTATHLVLQTLSMATRPDATAISQVVTRLQLNNIISPEVAQKINQSQIEAFFDTPLGQALLTHADSLQREAPFSMLLRGDQLFTQLTADEKILIHGIIDGYFETADGLVLFDYKTDHVKGDNPVAIQQVVDRYRGQVNLYARALTSIKHQKVAHKVLYLLDIGKMIEV